MAVRFDYFFFLLFGVYLISSFFFSQLSHSAGLPLVFPQGLRVEIGV
jgi:hypothetical protein